MKSNFLTKAFLLYTLIPAVVLNKSRIALVTVCPKNRTEVIDASTKLGCGTDKYGNNQYLCLSNKEKTSLVELCFDGVMGIQNEGICLEIHEGKLIQHRCQYFSNGCPKTHFFDYEFYKYPACQNINTKFQCYVSDPLCSLKPRTREASGHGAIVYIPVLGTLAVLIFVVIVVIRCWRKRNRSKILRSRAKRIKDIRIVLLGKKGAGKSATGNTILGTEFFESSAIESSTRECIKRISVRLGHKLVIVDTPGIFDSLRTNKQTQEEICKSINMTSPGPHAFILVFSISRFTEEDKKSVEHFVKYFGEEIYKYSIILFTREDELQENKSTIMDYIEKSPPELKTLLTKCGQRFIAFNNKLKEKTQDPQSVELLDMISMNIKQNKGKYYTEEMYTAATKLLKERKKKMYSKTTDDCRKVRQEKRITARLDLNRNDGEDIKLVENVK